MDGTLLIRHRGDYLWGSFYTAGADGHFETVAPATGCTLDRVPYRQAAVGEAVTDARRAAPAWARTSLEDRAVLLGQFRELLQARQGALAALVAKEMGKPVWEATLECLAAVRALDLLLDSAEELLSARPHPSGTGMLRRRPVGVTGVITPYPYPVYGALQLLLPVLLAGNTVVWKPSSKIPLVSQKIAEVFDAARLPPGTFSMVQGPGNPIGRALASHPGVDRVVAAGTAATADAIRSGGEAHLDPWVQSGGKGWAFVCEDADLDRAAYDIVTGAFLTCGQRANATSRVLMEPAIARALLQRVVALTAALQIGAPEHDDSFCGPLVDAPHRERFDAVLGRYGKAGIEFVREGGSGQLPRKLRQSGLSYVAPAVALVQGDLPPGLPLPEEVQGPLLVACLVEDLEAAARAFNAHPYGLATSVFTESEERFQQLAAVLESGTLNWNRGTIVASARYPNAGLGRSGRGAEANEGLLRATTWPQSTLAAAGRFDPSHRVPGMAWPEEMGSLDPSSLNTPPYRPLEDEPTIGSLEMIRRSIESSTEY